MSGRQIAPDVGTAVGAAETDGAGVGTVVGAAVGALPHLKPTSATPSQRSSGSVASAKKSRM